MAANEGKVGLSCLLRDHTFALEEYCASRRVIVNHQLSPERWSSYATWTSRRLRRSVRRAPREKRVPRARTIREKPGSRGVASCAPTDALLPARLPKRGIGTVRCTVCLHKDPLSQRSTVHADHVRPPAYDVGRQRIYDRILRQCRYHTLPKERFLRRVIMRFLRSYDRRK